MKLPANVRSTLKPIWGKALQAVHPKMVFPTYSKDIERSLFSANDPVRLGTVALALERIKAEVIPGAIAEIGVWRGDTSRFMHSVAPYRPLHLFDTFSGFSNGDARFRDTSLEFVKQNLGNLENVHFHVGEFPASAVGLEDKHFSLVMYDADMHEPAVAALEFFYPRLTVGGYFFLHDFNSNESDWAVHRAVTRFMADKPEKIIEIPDRFGTALFRKI